ncbi:hypothetical protein L6R50_12655 [Myxococcota bacterium]|nr:hypothetical protein [Myxococcota bacterium]
MNESMAIEQLLAAWLGAHLRTAFCGARLQMYAGGSRADGSDIDSWACRPARGVLAIGECKVQGPARAVYARERGARLLDHETYEGAIVDRAQSLFAEGNRWLSDYLSLGEEGSAWASLRRLELWFVANVHYEDSDEQVNLRLTHEVREALMGHVPEGVEILAFAVTTAGLMHGVLEVVRRDIVDEGYGRRYSHHQLDLFREVVRYLHPVVNGMGRGRADEVRLRAARPLGDRRTPNSTGTISTPDVTTLGATTALPSRERVLGVMAAISRELEAVPDPAAKLAREWGSRIRTWWVVDASGVRWPLKPMYAEVTHRLGRPACRASASEVNTLEARDWFGQLGVEVIGPA